MHSIKKYCAGIAFCLCCLLNASGQVSRQLDIPGRLQWDNANGYCGETAIQMIGLYYGNYISQNICRTVAGGEVLISVNDEAALDSLSFTHEEWDYNQSTPQYTSYLIWAKQHLYNYHPVIITAYIKGLSDPDYDHIIPAIGFSATDTGTFHTNDDLMYNSCYDSAFFTRSFQSIWDTRSMNGNGATYDYCIPKNINYGCAVTGIKDSLKITRPVSLSVDRWDEPNVTLGEQPVMLHANATVSGLNIGSRYALLRYDGYRHLPSANFSPINADAVFYFTATAATETYPDSFMSHTSVFYRCIQHNTTDIETTAPNLNLYVSPNPINADSKIYFDLPHPENAGLTIYDVCGGKVFAVAYEPMNTGKQMIALNGAHLAAGVYYCLLTTAQTNNSIKIIVAGH